MPCTNGHNNFDDVPTCRICGVNTSSRRPSSSRRPRRTTAWQSPRWSSASCGSTDRIDPGPSLRYQAKREIARSGQRGSGMATAGIVLGWVGIAGLILAISLWFTLFHSVPFPTCPSNCVHVNGS